MKTILMGKTRWHSRLYTYMRGAAASSVRTRLGLAPLWLGSLLYGGLVHGDARSYAWGLRRRYRLPCRVVSIGNLTLGGTGKTPLTMWVARWYQQQGWRVAVLSRGYGGRTADHPCVVSTGDDPLRTWRDVGDEPYLLAQELPGVPVLVGADRVRSGQYAYERFGAQVLVLDDGFQHHRLARDLDIVLIDATNPFGHGTLLPRGILREPLWALQRADAVVLTRVDLTPETVPTVAERIRRWYADRPIYQMTTTLLTVCEDASRRCGTAVQRPPRRVAAVVGIGNPEAFAATLTQCGWEVVALLVFADHHAYTKRDWRAIIDVARQHGANGLVTTTKDAVRLAPSWQAPLPVYTLRTGVAFTQGEQRFQQQLQALMIHAHAC